MDEPHPQCKGTHLTPQSSPALYFYDEKVVFRLDDEQLGGTYDRRTRELMRALVNTAEAFLDEQAVND